MPDDAWGLELWTETPPDAELERSLALVRRVLRRAGATGSTTSRAADPFVVLDLHSYNHRRDGADAPPAPADGEPRRQRRDRHRSTASVWGARRRPLHGRPRGSSEVARPRGLDVRENVRFHGGELSRWVNERYHDRGCALAIEFKKVFMDEWTGTRRRAPPRGAPSGARRRAFRAPCRRASRVRCAIVTTAVFPDLDLAVDRALSDIAGSFRFLLDVTPVDLVEARDAFWRDGRTPEFEYRPLADDPAVTTHRLAEVPVNDVEDPTRRAPAAGEAPRAAPAAADAGVPRHERVPRAEHRSVRRGGTRRCCSEAEDILEHGAADARPTPGPWLDADAFAQLAQAELDRYRAFAPDIESHVELRDGSTGVMVSNGDVLIAPTARVSAGARRGPAPARDRHARGDLRQRRAPAAPRARQRSRRHTRRPRKGWRCSPSTSWADSPRIACVSSPRAWSRSTRCSTAPSSPRCTADWSASACPKEQAFTITMRVFRSGGLTKDAVYLRGLHELVGHIGAGKPIETLWLGKMPLDAVPLVDDLHQRGLLVGPAAGPPVPRSSRAHVNASPASPRSLRWPHSSEVHREDRFRRQRHRHREARVHDGTTRARGRRPRSRDVAHGRGRLLAPRRRHRGGARSARRRGAQATRNRRSSHSVQDDEREPELVAVDDLDVLVHAQRPGRRHRSSGRGRSPPGVLFAQLSVAAGTLVVNDPGEPRQRRQQDLLPALPGGRAARAP